MSVHVPPSVYERTCTVVRVVDGDTLHVLADLGCDVTLAMVLRLYGVNAPETSTKTGLDAKAWAATWVAQHGPVFVLRTSKDQREKYGRYLADLLAQDGSTLCTDLLATGHAVPYLP